ncbi:DNA helicase [Fructilactobacillus florum 8D]|uniref:DNA helicase n=1 Tax=Fructilactobacillus florum 8D TaxID=1221538 RepID=W9EF98_9LACO|nr:RNA polymerase recycling motor HelD [Fructilactobacillus florum]EKK20576.1 DNA helicase [Fructilactobacillus florum 2F]ETO40818.1 DNA helicase [Fructilactobacillus florum 8D]
MDQRTANQYKIEQKRLDFVRGQLAVAQEQLGDTIKKSKAKQKDLESNFYDDVRVKTSTYEGQMETGVSVRQQQQLLTQHQNRWQTATRDLKTLQRLEQNAYFARVDLTEGKDAALEKIYIGLASFAALDNADNYLIYDWRAPICSVYYDSGMGTMTYEAPMGSRKVNVQLKRELQVVGSQVKLVFDTEEAVGDRVLLENLQQQSNPKMKSIVATIQQEQNTIIRDTKSELLIVQGAAGSGKTAAVLQRVAFLLYRYRGNLTPGQLILFSPNQLFNDYISQVLPELGEQNMVQMTYYQFLSRRVPRLTIETLEARFLNNLNPQRAAVTDFKNSLNFFKLLQQYAEQLNQAGMDFKNILFRGQVLISKEQITEIYYHFNQNYNLHNRLEATKSELLKIVNRHIQSEMKKRWVDEKIQNFSREEIEQLTATAPTPLQTEQQQYQFLARKLVRETFQKVRNQIKRNRFFNINQQFIDFLQAVPKLVSLATVGLDAPRWQQAVTTTVRDFKAGKISLSDVSIYLALFDLALGKHPDPQMRFLFIDEAQDYTGFQLAYLQWNFPRAKFTLLGDLNQAIFTHESAPAWSRELSQLFDPATTRMINLQKSYRSTTEITNFSKQLLTTGATIESFARRGPLPVIQQVKSATAAYQFLANELQTKLQGTTAIITKTLEEAHVVRDQLEACGQTVRLIQTENQRLTRGILVIPAYLAKGLEFDQVMLWNVSQENYPNQSTNELVYTMCTRAMHQLTIISVGTPAPAFSQVNPDDYQLVRE